jgi:hypothetical protein
MTEELIVVWQDAAENSRRWYPIGRLRGTSDGYEFVYTRGIEQAQRSAGFVGLHSFPDASRTYKSAELFPVFSNRLLSTSRPDYATFLSWLKVSPEEARPMFVLSRSGGKKTTDTIQVFPCPERTASGQLVMHFFAHGVRHIAGANERIDQLRPGDRLKLEADPANPVDSLALKVMDEDVQVGYCPRFLCGDLHKLITLVGDAVTTEVEQVNPPSIPIQYRLLCRLEAPWVEGFEPFAGDDYEPIASLDVAV